MVGTLRPLQGRWHVVLEDDRAGVAPGRAIGRSRATGGVAVDALQRSGRGCVAGEFRQEVRDGLGSAVFDGLRAVQLVRDRFRHWYVAMVCSYFFSKKIREDEERQMRRNGRLSGHGGPWCVQPSSIRRRRAWHRPRRILRCFRTPRPLPGSARLRCVKGPAPTICASIVLALAIAARRFKRYPLLARERGWEGKRRGRGERQCHGSASPQSSL
jgi:hypothetical protein